MHTQPRPNSDSRLLAWSVVYLLNLIIPGFFGIIVCREGGGTFGMVLGVVVFFAFVTWAVYHWPRFGRWATLGGVAVGLMQLAPVLQFWSGSLALALWGRMTGIATLKLGDGAIAEVGGFVVTILTGQPLFMVAIVIGILLDKLARYWSPPAPVAEDADDDVA